MNRQKRRVVLGAVAIALVAACVGGAALAATGQGGFLGTDRVGRQGDGSVVTSTGQRLTPAGTQVEFPGRTTAVAVRPDGKTAAFLVSQGGPLVVVDLATKKVTQTLAQSGAGSFDGLAYSHDGKKLFASLAGGSVVDADVAPDGTLTTAATITVPPPSSASTAGNPTGAGNAYPGGLAFSGDDKTVYVALSVSNALAVIDVASNSVTAQIPVGNVPHSVAVVGTTAFVTNEGGRPAQRGDTTNDSDGTAIVSDPYHGSAATGTVSVVDLVAGREIKEIAVGLHPTAVTASGNSLFVTNTNSDTVSEIDTTTQSVTRTIDVTPYPGAPYGSHPDGVAVLRDNRLAVTLGRDNAVGVYKLSKGGHEAAFLGLLPTGWYPSDITTGSRGELIVSNDKGVGNLGEPSSNGDGSGRATGSSYVASASVIADPSDGDLHKGTNTVRANNGWDAMDNNGARPGVAAKPIPDHVGEPSTIKHVIYIAKENRTYDQVMGDDTRGQGDPALAQFGKTVTPNQHALATQFPLVDNFYDSGQLSADGHQWFVQGDSPDYLEKAFGSFVRSYPSQAGDALAYLPSGFIWENALKHHKTVVDYGEYASSEGKGLTSTDVPSLKPLVVPTYPGFDPSISDQVRMRVFLNDFNSWVSSGTMPDLVMMSLPQDHTVAYAPTYPSVDAMVADNDVALGELVQALSTSPFWKDTAVLVEEDDPQNGLDHIDAHRSTFFAISPWTRHGGYVDHTYYSQVNALRTVEQILGLPPMNQMDQAAVPMRTLFADTPDMSPYSVQAPAVSMTARNPLTVGLTGMARAWSVASARMDFKHLDAVDPVVLDHAIWYAAHDFTVPYPGETRVLLPKEVAGGRINLPARERDDDH